MGEAGQDDRGSPLDEYFRELRQWLQETQRWNKMQMEHYAAYQLENSAARERASRPHMSNAETQQGPPGPQPSAQIPQQRVPRSSRRAGTQGVTYKQYRIPSLWKRFAAEVVDFLLLLSMKFMLILVVFEVTDILNIQNPWLIPTKDERVAAWHLSLLELYQVFVSIYYETAFLSSAIAATPGKYFMGLRVVYVETVITLPEFGEGTVACSPATVLTQQRALTRAITKHVLCAFLVPVFYSLLTIGFNRTRYDMYASSIVVEYNPNPVTIEL